MTTNYTRIWNYIAPPPNKKAGYATDTTLHNLMQSRIEISTHNHIVIRRVTWFGIIS